jgi:glycyl-tRNA synthetase
LVDAYREEEVEGETRVVLGLHPAISPIKAGVFPLVKKDGMPELATRLYHDLRKQVTCFYDDSGAIGRRYRRMDEAGTPFGITVDGETSAGGTVTVRQRLRCFKVVLLVSVDTERFGVSPCTVPTGPEEDMTRS